MRRRLFRYAALAILAVGSGTAIAAEYVQASNKPCTVWIKYPNPKDVIEWSGICRDGYISGFGILRHYFATGGSRSFTGNFSKGMLEGEGIDETGGAFYVGTYRSNRSDGFGRVSVPASSVDFIKSFESGPPETRGRWIGDRYVFEGIWRSGNPVRACADAVACGLEPPRTVTDAPPARGRSLSLN